MTSFERVKRNILRDIAGSRNHTAGSWANIMLNNTSRLTDVGEQEKFWNWMQNPEDDERPGVVCENFETHCEIARPKYTSVPLDGGDEKSKEVQLENEYKRNGSAMYVRVKPVAEEKSDD